MAKFLLSAVFLFCAISAKAVQFKVVCCDGTVHYCQGLSLKGYADFGGASLGDVNEYKDLIGKLECKDHASCYKSVEEMKSSNVIVMSSEDISQWDFFLRRSAHTAKSSNPNKEGKA